MDELRDFVRQWIGVMLVLVALARAVVLVAHDPLVGYANQYDMNRTSACLGLFPAKETAVATPEAPIALYRQGSRTAGCYQSTEVVIAATTVAIARAVGANVERIRLQWIGYAKLALLFLTALAIAWALRDHFGASVVHGLAVLLVLADPVVTLWFNTLYTEFGAIWALYTFVAAAVVLSLSETPAPLGWLLLIVSTIALAFSREQFALLGPALVLAAWPWLYHRSQRLAIAAFTIAFVAFAVSFVALPRPDAVRKANRADAYLGLVLPAAADPAKGLETLGLPATCESLVGANWYRQRGESIDTGCPQVYALSSFAFLRFLQGDAAALGRAGARVMPMTQGLAPSYVGTVEGEKGRLARELPWWGFSPLEQATVRLPAGAFMALTVAGFLLAPAALIVLLVMRRYRGDPLTPLLVAMLLGGIVIYSYLTTAFGDGMSEAARHFLPGQLALWAALVAAIAGIPFALKRWMEAKRESLLELAAGAAAILIAVFVGIAALEWMRAQPLAVGVIDHPEGREVPAAGFPVRGWALDPAGVESVEIQAGALRKPVKFGLPGPAATGMLRVHFIFPGYPDAENAGFAADLTAEDLAKAGAPNPVSLAVVVKGRNGASIEIDRRNLRFK